MSFEAERGRRSAAVDPPQSCEPEARPSVKIFTAETAPRFERFLAERGLLATFGAAKARYLTAFLREGATEFVRNAGRIQTEVAVVGDSVIPLVIADGEPTDCYLVSPYVHYIAYMIEEVRKMRPPIASLAIRVALRQMGRAFRVCLFDRIVSVNNWLFTTSLTSHVSEGELAALYEHLRRRFPSHALVYRGLDPRDQSLARALRAVGCEMLIHRPVLEWEPTRFGNMPMTTRYRVRRDMRLTDGEPYTARTPATLDREGAGRVAWMYEGVYMRKHSRHNAHFTPRYFETVVATGVCTIDLFERDGAPSAFVTCCDDESRLIAALVGYDPAVFDKRASPYSAVIGWVMKRAVRERKRLFLSTGASKYKRLRGATEVMEYEAFDVRHLHPMRRLPWFAMKEFLEFCTRFMDTGDI